MSKSIDLVSGAGGWNDAAYLMTPELSAGMDRDLQAILAKHREFAEVAHFIEPVKPALDFSAPEFAIYILDPKMPLPAIQVALKSLLAMYRGLGCEVHSFGEVRREVIQNGQSLGKQLVLPIIRDNRESDIHSPADRIGDLIVRLSGERLLKVQN